jgi:formylglycine-generating enzyme required for sulfatase activity
MYPWGNVCVADNVIYSANSGDETAEVGSRPAGSSWVGTYDMSGNVREWVSSISMSYPYNPMDGREDLGLIDAIRVLHGGSYLNTLDKYLNSTYRDAGPQNGGNFDTGFRCAVSQ